MTKKAIQFWLVGLVMVTFSLTAMASCPGDIKWDKPVSMPERITGQEPVEVIPADYDDYGVKVSGKKGMLTGYKLPDGWKSAIGGVKNLVLTNSGDLKHDPATVLNAKIFEKLTGIHLDLIEMKDALLWPKSFKK